MQPVWRYVLTGLFLVLCGIYDLRYRRIPVVLIGIFAAAGLLFLLQDITDWYFYVPGMSVGAVLLLFAAVTREEIGYGDGLVLAVTGMYLRGRDNFFLFAAALFLSACFSAVALVCKKAGKKSRLPFVPFLVASFGIMLSRNW